MTSTSEKHGPKNPRFEGALKKYIRLSVGGHRRTQLPYLIQDYLSGLSGRPRSRLDGDLHTERNSSIWGRLRLGPSGGSDGVSREAESLPRVMLYPQLAIVLTLRLSPFLCHYSEPAVMPHEPLGQPTSRSCQEPERAPSPKRFEEIWSDEVCR